MFLWRFRYFKSLKKHETKKCLLYCVTYCNKAYMQTCEVTTVNVIKCSRFIHDIHIRS